MLKDLLQYITSDPMSMDNQYLQMIVERTKHEELLDKFARHSRENIWECGENKETIIYDYTYSYGLSWDVFVNIDELSPIANVGMVSVVLTLLLHCYFDVGDLKFYGGCGMTDELGDVLISEADSEPSLDNAEFHNTIKSIVSGLREYFDLNEGQTVHSLFVSEDEDTGEVIEASCESTASICLIKLLNPKKEKLFHEVMDMIGLFRFEPTVCGVYEFDNFGYDYQTIYSEEVNKTIASLSNVNKLRDYDGYSDYFDCYEETQNEIMLKTINEILDENNSELEVIL